jgi:hypothetical protein
MFAIGFKMLHPILYEDTASRPSEENESVKLDDRIRLDLVGLHTITCRYFVVIQSGSWWS